MSKIALVIYDKCRPQQCEKGICAAANACARRLITQEAPNEIPMTNTALCRACGDCVRACPTGAVELFS
ncbi:MAG: 4Fe-4S binding protein [Dehalococcoidales bacterium]|nr:4Fe-4S binding protein [Dehalococcoidales bacterium]